MTEPQNSLVVLIFIGFDCNCAMHRVLEVESKCLEDLLREDLDQRLSHICSLGQFDVH